MLFVAACSGTTKVKNEGETKTGMIEEIPSWYAEKKGNKGVLNQKDKFYDVSYYSRYLIKSNEYF